MRRSSAAATGPAVAVVPVTSSARSEPARHASIERSVNAIGPRLREQRRVHGLSLQQTAALAGVSAASIHQVERGDMVPTITTLLKLASAFGLPLSSFVDDTVDDGAGASVVRAGERRPLASSWPGTERAAVTSGTPPFHVTGEVLEVSAGAESAKLRAGDTLHVLGDRSLSWHNTGRRIARVLLLSTPRDAS
jgi:transcriptional regulator with XRE-family HTH domain